MPSPASTVIEPSSAAAPAAASISRSIAAAAAAPPSTGLVNPPTAAPVNSSSAKAANYVNPLFVAANSAELSLVAAPNKPPPSSVAANSGFQAALSTVAAPALPPGFEEYILAQKNQIASPAAFPGAASLPKPKQGLLTEEDNDAVDNDVGGEGLEGLESQWGKLSLKQDIEGGTFSFSPDVEPTGLDGQPLEFFLLGTVRAIESFNPRTVEKAMLGAWSPCRPMEMTVIDENLYLFRFTHRLDINRAIREAPWRFQEYVLALQEVPRGFVVPKESLVMVPFWVQLYGVPTLWQREDVARFIGNLLGTVHDVDPKVRRHTGGGEPFLRVKVEVNTAVELVRGTTVVLGDSSVPIALKYERLFKFCSYCGLVDHVLNECEETLKPDFSLADCKYGEWLKGIPPRSSPWHADNWKPLSGNTGNPFAQKKQAIPPGFRALPAPVRPAPVPVTLNRQPVPVQNSYNPPIIFSAARHDSVSNSASKRRTVKGIRNGCQEMKKAEESSSTSKRRRGDENSSHNDGSTELI